MRSGLPPFRREIVSGTIIEKHWFRCPFKEKKEEKKRKGQEKHLFRLPSDQLAKVSHYVP